MELSINGQSFVGVGVVGRAKAYKIKASFDSSIEELRLNTCHRFKKYKKIGKKFEFNYEKSKKIENTGLCIMNLIAIDKKGDNRFGLIEFKNDVDLNLKGLTTCNGQTKAVEGVSVCQSQKSLRQSIEFLEKSTVYAQDECKKPFTYDSKTFFYDIQLGDCVFLFDAESGFHRHRTYGYHDEL